MKLQVLTTRISASSGREVNRAPPRSRRPIMTSESTRFLGQPNETKPTVGAVGREELLTSLLYPESNFRGRIGEFPREFSGKLETYFFAALRGIPAAVRTPFASAENSPPGSNSRYLWYASAQPLGRI